MSVFRIASDTTKAMNTITKTRTESLIFWKEAILKKKVSNLQRKKNALARKRVINHACRCETGAEDQCVKYRI